MSSLLSVENLRVTFYPEHPDRRFKAVEDASFTIDRGETLGLVGESGCGKSLTALSLLNLQPGTARAEGTLRFDGVEHPFGNPSLDRLRGRAIGMIFQEPMTALDPLYTVGEQLVETLRYLTPSGTAGRSHRERSVELLKRVQLDRPGERLDDYPHELSGGQQQRVMIALALAGEPDLLVADEPTTALDVTTERNIVALFHELAGEGLSILIITHDLPLIGEVSDRVAVMYSGYTVEWGPTEGLLRTPQHPYTRGLVASSGGLFDSERDRLPVIEGDVPDPADRPSGCPFHPRCPEAEPRCAREFPDVFRPVPDVETACWARES